MPADPGPPTAVCSDSPGKMGPGTQAPKLGLEPEGGPGPGAWKLGWNSPGPPRVRVVRTPAVTLAVRAVADGPLHMLASSSGPWVALRRGA